MKQNYLYSAFEDSPVLVWRQVAHHPDGADLDMI